jgi:hypothetical protein
MTTPAVLRWIAFGSAALAAGAGFLLVTIGRDLFSVEQRTSLSTIIAAVPFVVQCMFLVGQALPHMGERALRFGARGSDMFVSAFVLCLLLPYERLSSLSKGVAVPDWEGVPLALVTSLMCLAARIIQLWMTRPSSRQVGNTNSGGGSLD